MNELESNKDGLERFAREQYLMKREEEDIFIFEEKWDNFNIIRWNI